VADSEISSSSIYVMLKSLPTKVGGKKSKYLQYSTVKEEGKNPPSNTVSKNMFLNVIL
jgi:hypothetical protein